MGEEQGYFHEREIGKLTEAVEGLRRDVGELKSDFKGMRKDFSDETGRMKMKLGKLATTVSLIVSGIFFVLKEAVAKLFS